VHPRKNVCPLVNAFPRDALRADDRHEGKTVTAPQFPHNSLD
jgi:hypothetical protein